MRLLAALLGFSLLAAVPARAGEAEADADLSAAAGGRQAPALYRDVIARVEAAPAKTAAQKERKRRKLAVLHSKLGCAVERLGGIEGRPTSAAAIDEFRQAIALDPVLAFPYYGVARNLVDPWGRGDSGEALRQIGRALARDPGIAAFWATKAAVEYDGGKNLEGSIADCRKAVGLAAIWDAGGMQPCGSFFHRSALAEAEGRAVDAKANANRALSYKSLGDRDLRYLDAVLARRAKREREATDE